MNLYTNILYFCASLNDSSSNVDLSLPRIVLYCQDPVFVSYFSPVVSVQTLMFGVTRSLLLLEYNHLNDFELGFVVTKYVIWLLSGSSSSDLISSTSIKEKG